MNEETVQKLATSHPQLAEKILKIPDENLRKEMAYQTIKTLSLHKPEDKKSTVQDQINQKQRSYYYRPTGIATPPITDSSDFSEVGKKQAYEKVQALIRAKRG
jgi:hypothetical protein